VEKLRLEAGNVGYVCGVFGYIYVGIGEMEFGLMCDDEQ